MLIEYINDHQAQFWFALGFVLLSIEVATGMVTGILLFASLGSLLTGLLMLTGVLEEVWSVGISSAAICSAIAMGVLWRPLKNMQAQGKPKKDNSSDLVGYEFVLKQDISFVSPGSTRYSGIEWRVEIDPDVALEKISAGQKVKVNSVEVGKFFVRPV